MSAVETTTAIRYADSTEYLRYPMIRDLDPSDTDLSFHFIGTSTSHSAVGDWHYDDTEEQDCQYWYARVLIGPDGLALAADTYQVRLNVAAGDESTIYDLGDLLVLPAEG